MGLTPVDVPAPDAARPARSLVFGLGVAMMLGPASTDLYLPALPALALDLEATPAQAQATVAAFLAGMGVSQLLYGPLSDRVGRRGPLLAGLSLYTLAAIACALSSSLGALLTARFLQAVGACAGQVLARASVRDRFALRRSAQVLSRLMLVAGVAPILAPLLGAQLAAAGWRATFVAQALIGLALLLWALRGFDESRPPAARLAVRGESPLGSLLHVLRQRSVIGFVGCASLNAVGFFAYLACAPSLLMGTYGLSARAFGWVFAVNAVGFIGAYQLNAWLLARYSPIEILRRTRLPTIAVALVLVYDALSGAFGLMGVLVPLFFALSSHGLIGANAVACALGADSARTGTISSVSGCAGFGLGALAAVASGALQDGTARPLAVLVLAAMLASSLALYGIALRTPDGAARNTALDARG